MQTNSNNLKSGIWLTKIKWLGLASFLITSDSGTRIITDPYETGGDLSYGEIRESAM